MLHHLPPVIIYDEDKKFFYEALDQFDHEELLDPMVKFVKYEMEKNWMHRFKH